MFFSKEDSQRLVEVLQHIISMRSHKIKPQIDDEFKKEMREAIQNPAWLPELVGTLEDLANSVKSLVQTLEGKGYLEEICIKSLAEIQSEIKKSKPKKAPIKKKPMAKKKVVVPKVLE